MSIKDRFRELGLASLGPSYQTRIADIFDNNVRTVRRWASSDDPTPPPQDVIDYLESFVAARSALPEWIFGQDTEFRRNYVIHTQAPRFIGRLVFDGEKENSPANKISGIVFGFERFTVCEIVWIDQPKGDEVSLLRLNSVLGDAIDAAIHNGVLK